MRGGYRGAMRIRPYVPDDRVACVRIARSNTPDFVLPEEVEGYAGWLDRACLAATPGEACDYFVLASEPIAGASELLACGGIAWAHTAPVATLCWGLVRRDLHRRGLGSLLLAHRIDLARARGVQEVLMDTSQHALAFFLRAGFRVAGSVADGYGPGLHRHDLSLRLAT
jgi:GNAT superfamily N-acetyltransferase